MCVWGGGVWGQRFSKGVRSISPHDQFSTPTVSDFNSNKTSCVALRVNASKSIRIRAVAVMRGR